MAPRPSIRRLACALSFALALSHAPVALAQAARGAPTKPATPPTTTPPNTPPPTTTPPTTTPTSPTTPGTPGAAETEERLREAKAMFREGNTLRKAGDVAGALEFYLRSRRLVPSMPNTMNSAYCLEEVGRLDEALELYEEVLTKFRDDLSESEQQDISLSMSGLRRKLGSIDVSGNVGGMLLVDGKVRGTLPLIGPVRVLPGRHTVRVLREGWEPFEASLSVVTGQTVPVDVKQKLLVQTGRLRITSDNVDGADLLLDGAPLGQLPWEGTLAPGPHLFSVRKGHVGTAPRIASVVQGQTVTVSAVGVALGSDVRVVPEPPTADVSIDGVTVGKGTWSGALPLGPHVFEGREIGYVTARVTHEETTAPAPIVALHLRIDPSHPRWAIPGRVPGIFRVDLFGGVALAPSFGSDAEIACSRGHCSREPLATGGLAGVRATYIWPSGVFVEGGTGYLSIQRGITRTIDDSFTIRASATTVPFTYTVSDAMRLAGPFLAVGAGYTRPLARRLRIAGALDLGAAILTARDALRGSASDGARTLDLAIDQSGAPTRSVAMFLEPEVRLTVDLGPLDVGIGLGAAFFPLDGPRYPTGEAQVTGASCQDHPGTVDCAPGKGVVAVERAYSGFVVLLPTLIVGRAF